MAARKHRATGREPPGGARPGAGRPEGATNTLGYGEVKALEAMGFRVPATASPGVSQLADEALGRLIDVMRERVHFTMAGHVLKAATRIREEVCGPLTQRLEHAGPDGGALVVEIRKLTPMEEGEPNDAPPDPTQPLLTE